MNKNKILAIFILTLLVISCSKAGIDNTSSTNWVTLESEKQKEELFTEEEKKLVEDNTVEVKDTEKENIKEETSEPIDVVKKLAISSKCIWCGHCIKFSPTNFTFDNSTHKAIVISQENINTWKVSNAINRCPVSAISIS